MYIFRKTNKIIKKLQILWSRIQRLWVGFQTLSPAVQCFYMENETETKKEIVMEHISFKIFTYYFPQLVLTENTLIKYLCRNNDGRPKGRNIIINLNWGQCYCSGNERSLSKFPSYHYINSFT